MASFSVRTLPVTPDVVASRQEQMKQVEAMCRSQVQWWETDTVAEYRRRRREGDGFPKPALFEGARTLSIRARDGRAIELRIINACSEIKGVLLHFHAGGFVIGSAKSYDNYLATLSKQLGLAAVSVEYRLAPENPFPAAEEDAIDAAIFAASEEGQRSLGGALRIVAGESAGGCLALKAALALRSAETQLAAVICSYGAFDVSGTPSLLRHKREAVLSCDMMLRFINSYTPGLTTEDRKQGSCSPVYAELSNDLPPALFLCGTEDPLIDDSLLMAASWGAVGNVSELVLVPAAWHAFTLIPAGEVTDQGVAEVVGFARKSL